MYVIRVTAPISTWNVQTGFFTKCYQASINSEKGTWIGFTNLDEEWNLIHQFKTRKSAENKLKFLQQKIDDNGYMWGWQLNIEEITEEDLM